MKALGDGESLFISRDFGGALDALAYIARHEDEREPVRTFLLRYVNHPKQTVRTSAIRALGTLGDARAIAALEAFDVGADGDPVKQAAAEALRALRDGREAPAQVRELREQVLELQKQNEKLRERVDEVLKKVEAKLQ
jgi:HEAT repeat protein